MKHINFTLLSVFLIAGGTLQAQERPLKERPDAFPPKEESMAAKAVSMAATVEQMADWDRYPTYGTYVEMMQRWAAQYPDLCRLDTIGTSVNGRLILCMNLHNRNADQSVAAPQFFYSSTMHGDEVTGYVMMLRLIDTLLRGFEDNPQYQTLMNTVDIFINPLSNPDGTYRNGDNTVQGSQRYNANYVDLNRNYPDPFGTQPVDELQPENEAMMAYIEAHHFRLSANLHGGSEVMNYPWDSFTSDERPHLDREWWIEVCKRFVDTSRTYSSNHFRDVLSSGYIEGGDWYVIPNGRQDYMNYYHNCREMTMELSTTKLLSSDRLPEYWRFLQHSLVNYMAEIFTIPVVEGISEAEGADHGLRVYPNPATSKVSLAAPAAAPMELLDMQGRRVAAYPAGTCVIDVSMLHGGLYVLTDGVRRTKIVKR